MKPDEWRRAYQLYEAATDLPPAERRAYLDSIKAGPEVVAEVLALLEQSQDPGIAPEEAAQSGLTAGTVFGRYVIVGAIGHGAMGDVYAARDSELDRIVALKSLNSERMGARSAINRFISEAKAASGLNHPNIVTVYEVLHSGSALAIAMELVEGRSLRELCDEPKDVEQVIHWGQQIASALGAAHAQGIVHRDIKPENIMLRPDGLIKVLDFGLARHLGGVNQTSTAGLPVGTLRYMSPEQARGDAVTASTDVFSLGMVLYELATAHHPFAADSPFATAYAIAGTEPRAPSSVNYAIPPGLESLILAMLAKDPQARPTAAELAEKLSSNLIEVGKTRGSRPRRRHVFRGRSSSRSIRYSVPAVVTAIVVTLLVIYFRWRTQPQQTWAVSQIAPFTTLPDQQATPSFSPDGKTVAFAWGSVITHRFCICTKPTNGGKENCWTKAGQSEYSPAWSPDGKWIAYLRGPWGGECALYIRSPVTGDSHKLADIPPGNWPTQRALAWTHDAKALVVKKNLRLFLISLSGQQRELTAPPETVSDYDPAVSSDGRELVFTRGAQLASTLYYVRLAHPESLHRVPLPQFKYPPFLDACWFPNRRELLVDSGSMGEIWLVPLEGKPQLLARDVYSILDVAASPDGHHVLYVQDRSNINLWTLNLKSPHPTPERAESIATTRNELDPRYSPDGRMVAFVSDRSGYDEVWAGRSDGSELNQLTHFEGPETSSPYWSPDGKWLTFDSRLEGTASVFVIPASGGAPKPITPKGVASEFPSWSHDGKWIYFSSHRSGAMQIWRARPDGTAEEQITRKGAYAAIDSNDSRFIYYTKSWNQDDGLRRLSLETGEDVRILPRVLQRAFSVNQNAIFYGSLVEGFTRTAVGKLPYGAVKPTAIAIFPRPIVLGLSVRSDESELTLGQLDSHTSQLMMINLAPK